MKKLLLILLCLPLISLAQQTYVPDDNFENYLESNGMGNGIAKSIANVKQLKNAILYFEKKSLQEICKNYIEKKSGATNHILQSI